MIVGVLFTFTLTSAQTGDENKSISYKLDEELVRKVMEPSTSEVDKANRQVMVDFIERFCTSYVVKDLGFIQNVFGEGLLSFVKGNLVSIESRKKGQESSDKRINYQFQSKKQYVSILQRVFNKNVSVEVLLSDIVVEVRPNKPNVYGLRLKHGWSSGPYMDEGYIFLLWDFTNPDAPQIHVRTWQPTEFVVGKPLDEDEIFTIDDFDV